MLGDPDLDVKFQPNRRAPVDAKLGSLIYILPVHLSPSQTVTVLLVSAVLEHPSLRLCKSCF